MDVCIDFICKEYMNINCDSCENKSCDCNPSCNECIYYHKLCDGLECLEDTTDVKGI